MILQDKGFDVIVIYLIFFWDIKKPFYIILNIPEIIY